MSSRARAIALVVAAFALIAANFLFTAHYVNSTVNSTLRASQRAAAASQKAGAASQKAGAASVSVAELCQAGNAARADQVGLWTFLIRLSKPPRTAEQRRLVARFEHHLRVVFAPQNCARLR